MENLHIDIYKLTALLSTIAGVLIFLFREWGRVFLEGRKFSRQVTGVARPAETSTAAVPATPSDREPGPPVKKSRGKAIFVVPLGLALAVPLAWKSLGDCEAKVVNPVRVAFEVTEMSVSINVSEKRLTTLRASEAGRADYSTTNIRFTRLDESAKSFSKIITANSRSPAPRVDCAAPFACELHAVEIPYVDRDQQAYLLTTDVSRIPVGRETQLTYDTVYLNEFGESLYEVAGLLIEYPTIAASISIQFPNDRHAVSPTFELRPQFDAQASWVDHPEYLVSEGARGLRQLSWSIRNPRIAHYYQIQWQWQGD